MAVVEVRCPECDSLNVVKYGRQPNGAQRFICHNPACNRRIFLLNYRSKSSSATARQQIIDLALNGADVEETARLLKLPTQTVLEVFQMLSRFSLPAATPRSSGRRSAPPQAAAG
ncbi:IS1 family transposase [Candidatus Magnetaquicoccus inordinatus]|uniref:IS1 family transposase n=1 Tax=Candidatus Magnetaquicoccus inordinatus TaxID=2496818 RepID=UPI00102CEF6B|nr:IS1 family transposase [Candidatus Magnetaquicoccus inordinatus]